MLDNKVKNCYTCNLGGTFMEYLFVHDSILSSVLWLNYFISRALVASSSCVKCVCARSHITVAGQASLSIELPWQEYWSG